jgi:OmpR-family two-component system manganese-sensing response regulator
VQGISPAYFCQSRSAHALDQFADSEKIKELSKVLLVEDDLEMSKNIKDWLSSERHVVDAVNSGNDARACLMCGEYDLLIVDWQLPGMSGIELIKEHRSRKGETPILMLTGKRSIDEKEEGLDAGADDYLTKPFHMRELMARVRALLRRPAQAIGNVLTAGDIVLNLSIYQATRAGKSIDLLKKEFALLELLMRYPGRAFSSEALLTRLWSADEDTSPEAVRQCVKRLREKLCKDGSPSPIKTVHGLGYKFDLDDSAPS